MSVKDLNTWHKHQDIDGFIRYETLVTYGLALIVADSPEGPYGQLTTADYEELTSCLKCASLEEAHAKILVLSRQYFEQALANLSS